MGYKDVVPLAGTWIETPKSSVRLFGVMSFPLRERGLKLSFSRSCSNLLSSFPLRERGLKPPGEPFIVYPA